MVPSRTTKDWSKAETSQYQPIQAQPLADRDLETSWTKFWFFPGLAATTVITIIINVALQHHWALGGASFIYVFNHRATVSLVVQTIAGLLGIAHVATARTILNYASREKLSRRPISLDRLNFSASLTTSQINWTLPLEKLCIVLILAVASLVPAALWAGALTPISISLTKTDFTNVSVPTYSDSTEMLWNSSWASNERVKQRTNLGLFSYSPQIDRYGGLNINGAHASTIDGTLPLHTKNDNSNFTYQGRSHGVGSLVGLIDNGLDLRHGIVGYDFNETGYLFDTDCIYNSTSNFTLSLQSDGYPAIYYASGADPLHTLQPDGGHFPMIGFNGSNLIVAVAEWQYGSYPTPQQRFMYLAIASGSSYGELNTVQCRFNWTPTLFAVHVNNTEKLISTSPITSQNVEDIEPSAFIAQAAGQSVADMSMIATTFYTSVLGDMFLNNIANVLNQTTDETTERKTLRAIEESILAISDDALVATSSAQLVIAHDTKLVPATVYVQAGQIGQDIYIYAITCLNAAIVTCAIFAAILTRGWRKLPRFDFTNTKSVVVGSSYGGSAVAAALTNSSRQDLEHDMHVWGGRSRDQSAGRIRVMLRRTENGLSLGLA